MGSLPVRWLGRLVVQAVSTDDAAFYENLLSEGADLLAPHKVKDLWKTIRRSLPQRKAKRQKTPPLKDVKLEDQWIPYLCDLELGEVTSLQNLVERCSNRQNCMPSPTCWTWTDIPTLQDLEIVFRQVQPGRSTGLDAIPSDVYHRFAPQLATFFFPLLVGHEPVQLKGGGIAMINKKGPHDVVSNFRSIMLLPAFSKRVRTLLRTRLAAFLSPLRPPGHMGAFQGQQIPFGSQAVKLYGSIGHAAQLSCGVLVIDLSNAFHRLLRETVLGVEDSKEWDDLLSSPRLASWRVWAARQPS